MQNGDTTEMHDTQVSHVPMCACNGACLGRDDGGCRMPRGNGNLGGGSWTAGACPGTKDEGQGSGVLDRRAKAGWRSRKARIRPGKAKLGRRTRMERFDALGIKKFGSMGSLKPSPANPGGLTVVRRWKG